MPCQYKKNVFSYQKRLLLKGNVKGYRKICLELLNVQQHTLQKQSHSYTYMEPPGRQSNTIACDLIDHSNHVLLRATHTGWSCLSHTAVKPDSPLAQNFCQFYFPVP